MQGLLAILALCGAAAANQDAASRAGDLYRQQRWAEVVSLWRGQQDPAAELNFYAAMSLARLNQRPEARAVLEAGQRKSPGDKRFPLELGGLDFAEHNLASARTHLRRALYLDPGDPYANDLLASIYFVGGNLEAALRYWNRVDKPRIDEIRMAPVPKADPVLVDAAFFAPASTLRLRELWATQANLELLGIFSRYQFALTPRASDEGFDLVFHSAERNGWGSTPTEGLASLLRGVAYETLYPEFYNLGRRAVNVTSLIRLDPNKLRVFAKLGAPVGGPQHRFEAFLDARRENWDLTRSFHGAGPAPTDLRLDKIEGGVAIRSVVNEQWQWTTGVSVSDREFARLRNADAAFTGGLMVRCRARVDHPLLRLPEHRLTVQSSATGEMGKLLAQGYGSFERLSGAVDAHWLPQAQGDKYELAAGVRSGRTFGPVPLDELLVLGLERDNDLALGAHIGTHRGKKGSAPLGRNYFLVNAEADRAVFQNAFFKIGFGPFLDSGKITDPSGPFGEPKWLSDVGARLKLRILGRVGIAFSYGKDLRSGRNAFYLTALN